MIIAAMGSHNRKQTTAGNAQALCPSNAIYFQMGSIGRRTSGKWAVWWVGWRYVGVLVWWCDGVVVLCGGVVVW